MKPTQPSFYDVHDELLEYDLAVHPSESHGAMCGYLCAQHEANFVAWCHTILFEMDLGSTAVSPEGQEAQRDPGRYHMLRMLHSAAAEQLADSHYGFQLFLPQEDEDVADRSDALAAWCRGFLFGLTASGASQSSLFSTDTNELIHDFSEIAKLDFEGVDERDEGDAAAFEEVMEYVRIGVLFIWAELLGQSSSNTTPVQH